MTTVSNDNDITLAELRQDLDDMIASSSASGFWTTAMKHDWLNRAGQKVCSFFRWPFLELAVYTTTRDGREYYSYPQGALRFKPNSIYQISIEDEDYNNSQGRGRRTWAEYVRAKEDEDDTKIFANHNGLYFLNPVPANGKEMTLYGLKGWQKLEEEGDTPITPTEFDESILRLALAQALRKAKKFNEARAEMSEVLDQNVGTLAMLKADILSEGALGYGGEATSSRFQRP